MVIAPFGQEERDAALTKLPRWELRDDKLHRQFHFADFGHAFAFMTQVALLAEKMQHHPEWSNVYNRMTVDLTTHDAGGISPLDVELAEQIDQLVP